MRQSTEVLAALLVGGFLLCQGCSREVRGADGDIEAKITEGTLTATMDRGINQVFASVQEAVHQLGLTTIMAEQDGVGAEVLARDAQGQNITIKLDPVSPNKTTLTLRFGIFGDNNKSGVVFRKIQENLRAG